MDLVTELVPWAAGPGAERVTALDHEVRDHTVEDRSVVKLVAGLGPGTGIGPLPGALGQFDEVTHGLRRLVREEPDLDRALVGVQCCGKRVGHAGNPRIAGAVAG